MQHVPLSTARNPAPAIAVLRAATRPLHDRLEQNLAIARQGAGRAEYQAYLEILWGWHAGFETDLWAHPWPAEIEAGERAAKLQWLAADLQALGLDRAAIGALPQSGFRPDLESPAARYGLAYVVEGAQLGIRVLRKQLGPQLAPWSPIWLQGYGDKASARWKCLTACLERELDREQAQSTAAEAARAAFQSLVNWFGQRAG